MADLIATPPRLATCTWHHPVSLKGLLPKDSRRSLARRRAGAADQLATAVGADRSQSLRTGRAERALVGADIGFIGWCKRCSTSLAHAPHLQWHRRPPTMGHGWLGGRRRNSPHDVM